MKIHRLGPLSLVFALGSTVLVWLALEPELRPYPVLAALGAALLLLAPLLAVTALILGRRDRPGGRWPAWTALAVWAGVLSLLLPLLASSGRGPARDRAALANLEGGLEELGVAYRAGGEAALFHRLENQDFRNPWDRGQPAWQPHLLASGPGADAAEALARQQAASLGQVVFVLSAPPGPRWLAGAVRTHYRRAGRGLAMDAAGVGAKAVRLEP